MQNGEIQIINRDKLCKLVYCYFMAVWGTVKTIALRWRGGPAVLLPEADGLQAVVHQTVWGTEGQ